MRGASWRLAVEDVRVAQFREKVRDEELLKSA